MVKTARSALKQIDFIRRDMSKKILVVDDDPTSLRTVEGLLTANGYFVKTSTHAGDIEKRVREFNPHLIVMDLMMPDISGSQAVEKLQRNPVLSRIPVVFLTALKMKDEERGLEFEVSVESKTYRTLTKPFDAKALLVEVEGLLK